LRRRTVCFVTASRPCPGIACVAVGLVVTFGNHEFDNKDAGIMR
jgi:hypothetical protein